MARTHPNPLTNPLHYAAKQKPVAAAPVSYGMAQRTLPGYDYVIVGAGAAGSVLASKLSEDKDVTVLLLEAGGDNNVLESKVPLMYARMFHTKNDWDYYTVEQPNVGHRRLYWPRGRLLGGSSSLNGQMYHHCNKSDFDEWETELGCKGWGYENLAPYFRRMEKFTPNLNRPAINMTHRGSLGEWQTGYSNLMPIVEEGFLNSCEESGIPLSEDINTPEGNIGVTRFQTFIDAKGQRSSLATAYLTSDVRKRPNLYIATGAQVSRVLYDHINEDAPRAIGVEFQTARDGDLYMVHSKREVILSGGTINTPQILKLSGIGPAEELKSLGIPVIKENAAVGENMKDHLCGTGIYCKAKPGTCLDYLNYGLKALPAMAQWLLTGTGPLTSNVAEAAAFIRSVDYKSPVSEANNLPAFHGSLNSGPDLELICAPLAYIHHGEEISPPGDDVFSLTALALRPRSSGTIKLKTRNPFDHPLIDPRYLSDEHDNDKKVLLAGLRLNMKIVRSKAFEKYFVPVPVNDDPASEWWPYSASDMDAISDDQLLRFVVERAFTLYHPVGSARMGPSEKNSVVDLNCNVHGVESLRVMDASVFPEQVGGHPCAPVAAMAYKISDMIKEHYSLV